MNNLVALLVAIGIISVASIGLLSNTVDLDIQKLGSFPSIDTFNTFACSCENPNNPGEFGSQYCDMNDPDFDPNKICIWENSESTETQTLGFTSSSWETSSEDDGSQTIQESSLQLQDTNTCQWPSGYYPDYKYSSPAYFYIDIEIDLLTKGQTGQNDDSHPGKGKTTISDPTLAEALQAHGGGVNKLARESVAALLNAAHPDVDYPYTATQIISITQKAFNDEDYSIANEFSKHNRQRGSPCT